MIHETRVRPLNERMPAKGDYVLYWMQQSQRANCNHALEFAIRAANARGLPVVVGFGLTGGYPEANRRHYAFILQGLQETERDLRDRNIGFVVRWGSPDEVALALASDAALLVCDRGYLRHQKRWRQRVAERAACPMVQVESDVVVPVEAASDRQESAARTLRPKLRRVWDDYLRDLDETKPVRAARSFGIEGDADLTDLNGLLGRLDSGVAPVRRFRGGGSEAARRLLRRFLDHQLQGYADGRREPGAFRCSRLSP